MRAFYFGPWGAAGHYLWTPAGDHPRRETAGPWSPRDLDANSYEREYGGRTVALPGGFCPPDPEERQGVWRLTRGADAAGAPWTAIGAWDRTCDRRGGCKAIFIAEGAHDEQGMRTIAAERFPAVWARIVAGGVP